MTPDDLTCIRLAGYNAEVTEAVIKRLIADVDSCVRSRAAGSSLCGRKNCGGASDRLCGHSEITLACGNPVKPYTF